MTQVDDAMVALASVTSWPAAAELLREIAVAAVFGALVRRPGDIVLEPIDDAHGETRSRQRGLEQCS